MESNKDADNVRRTEAAAAAAVDPDARAARTRIALGNALVELMLAHDFGDISVQMILDRAGVGRATFYSHFRNKRDLLLGDAERFGAMLQHHFLMSETGGRRLAPVAELFSHVAEYQEFQNALEKSGLRAEMYDLVTDSLAGIIERRLSALVPAYSTSPLRESGGARVFAGACMEMLRWWLRRPTRPSAEEMDRRYHEIVWSGLRAQLGD